MDFGSIPVPGALRIYPCCSTSTLTIRILRKSLLDSPNKQLTKRVELAYAANADTVDIIGLPLIFFNFTIWGCAVETTNFSLRTITPNKIKINSHLDKFLVHHHL